MTYIDSNTDPSDLNEPHDPIVQIEKVEKHVQDLIFLQEILIGYLEPLQNIQLALETIETLLEEYEAIRDELVMIRSAPSNWYLGALN